MTWLLKREPIQYEQGDDPLGRASHKLAAWEYIWRYKDEAAA